MLSSVKRIIYSGWVKFKRQSSLSVATVFILVLTILLISSLYVARFVAESLISDIKQKVDISVYFKSDVPEKDILKVKKEISEIPEVKDVRYISKEDALRRFMKMNENNPKIIKGLKVVGLNPLLPALNIRAQEASQYQAISNFLENGSIKGLIDHANFPQKKLVIKRLFFLTSSVDKIGLSLSVILALFAVLVAFNTIKIAIYSSREEISIMKLVGASNWFVRGPFVVQGFICGSISAILSILIFGVICYFISPKFMTIAPGINIYNYFSENIVMIFLAQLFIGVGLGVFSSAVAVRKYLRI